MATQLLGRPVFLTGLWLLVLSFSCLAQEPSNHLKAVLEMRGDKSVVPYLRVLDDATLLSMCREIGVLEDRNMIPAYEGPSLIDVILVAILGERGTLTSGMLVDVVGDRLAPLSWRRRALDYLTDPRCVRTEGVDLTGTLAVLMKLLADDREEVSIRDDAVKECTRVVTYGYYWLLCKSEGREPERDLRLRPRVRQENLPEWELHDHRVREFVDLAVSLARREDTPELIRRESIPYALRRTVLERGLKTPHLEAIQALARDMARNETLGRQYRLLGLDIKGLLSSGGAARQ